MFCSCRKNTACDSRSENRATSTLAPVTSLRPDDWTWIAARWMTRWKPAVGLASTTPSTARPGQLVVEEVHQAGPQPLDLDRAGLEHGHRVLVLGQRHQQMLEGRVFVLTGIGQRQRPAQGLLECSRQHGHHLSSSSGSLATLASRAAASLLLHRALQRMLVLARELDHLGHLGLGDLEGVDAADADAVVCTWSMIRVASSRLLAKNRSST